MSCFRRCEGHRDGVVTYPSATAVRKATARSISASTSLTVLGTNGDDPGDEDEDVVVVVVEDEEEEEEE